LVAGVGRIVPPSMWDGVRSRVVGTEPWDADLEVLPLDLVDRVVGPVGPIDVDEALRSTDCPVAPELFR
jgi:hypothetical protein